MYDVTPISHVKTNVDQDTTTGVLSQRPTGTRSSLTFSAHGDKQFGGMQCWAVKAKIVASAATLVTTNIDITKPVLPCSYRIVKIESVGHSLQTGTSPDHKLDIQKGDGAASEAFSNIVAQIDLDGDTDETLINRPLIIAAQQLLETGKTLRLSYGITAGASFTGTFESDTYIYVIPAVA